MSPWRDWQPQISNTVWVAEPVTDRFVAHRRSFRVSFSISDVPITVCKMTGEIVSQPTAVSCLALTWCSCWFVLDNMPYCIHTHFGRINFVLNRTRVWRSNKQRYKRKELECIAIDRYSRIVLFSNFTYERQPPHIRIRNRMWSNDHTEFKHITILLKWKLSGVRPARTAN